MRTEGSSRQDEAAAGDGGQGCAVRRAGRRDAALLARLGSRSFREAWAGFNRPADMDAYCAQHFSEARIGEDFASSATRYLLAECGGQPVGYLRMAAGPAPACVSADAPLEISRLYVLRAWHGRGPGAALMAACLRDAAALHDVAWLAVWQQAPQALAFYGKWGFATVGTTTFRLGESLQDDFVMARRLEGDSPVRSAG